MNKLILSLTALMMFFLVACQKDVLQTDIIKDAQTTNSIGLELPTDIKVEDGIMHFDNLEHFSNTLNALSDTENHIRTTEELDQWEQSLGFTSMTSICQKVLEEKSLELEQITNQDELDAFVAANAENVEITLHEDGSVELDSKFNKSLLGRLINEEGFVYIEGTLSLMDNEHQIVVLDNDMDKARNAKMSLQENPKDGVYVFKSIYPLKSDCLNLYECEAISNPPNKVRRKVAGKWYVLANVNTTNEVQTNVEWDLNGQLICEMRSKIIKNFAWSNNWNDQMGWSIGYAAEGTLGEYSGGTGWSSETAKIDYSHSFLHQKAWGNIKPTEYMKFKYIGAWVDNEEYGDNMGDWNTTDTDPGADCRCWVNCWDNGNSDNNNQQGPNGTTIGTGTSGNDNNLKSCRFDEECDAGEFCFEGKCHPL